MAIVGDILHSRVARSSAIGLRTLGAEVRLVGPPTLVPREAESLGVCRYHLEEGLAGADVVMVLRLQRERQGRNFIPTIEEYSRLFCVTRQALSLASREVLVLHPGPVNRGVEIASDVVDGPASVVMDQVTNGVAVRMAVLFLLVSARAARRAQEKPVPLAATGR